MQLTLTVCCSSQAARRVDLHKQKVKFSLAAYLRAVSLSSQS